MDDRTAGAVITGAATMAEAAVVATADEAEEVVGTAGVGEAAEENGGAPPRGPA